MSETISISTVGSRVSKWGEGPIFWKDDLIYVDIEGHSLIRLNPETEVEQVWEMGSGSVRSFRENPEVLFVRGIPEFTTLIQNRREKNLADPEAEKDQIIDSMMGNAIHPFDFGPEPLAR